MIRYPFGMVRSTVYSQTGGDPFNTQKPPSPSPAALSADAHNTVPPTANLSMMLKARKSKKQPKQRY